MPKTMYSQLNINNNQNEIDVCADCSQLNPSWASINHGTLICDQCAIIHRSLGRIISQIKPLNGNNWKKSQLKMVLDLYRSGSNSIWEHTLLDPHLSGHHHHHHHNQHYYHNKQSNNYQKNKKPQPNDPINPNKSDFIRAKYQSYAFVNKSSHNIKDDLETESDISEQLHSSVRTPNLKTSLRLLVAGANPNYIHTEKFNSPLHMAAKSGQMSQIELLLAYGANSTIVDSRNKSAIDYARDAGHYDIFYRLIEHQFDLTDTLTGFICQGKQPNHRIGEHFLFIDIKIETILNQKSNDDQQQQQQQSLRNSNELKFRNELYQQLQTLSNKLFQELIRDLYDEIDRREINQFISKKYSNENGKLSLIHQQLIIPFLPVYQYFSTTRNQERQKLALLNTKELTLLIVDVLMEIRNRIYNINDNDKNIDLINNNNNNLDDSEPLYDSVPSDDDDDDNDNYDNNDLEEEELLLEKNNNDKDERNKKNLSIINNNNNNNNNNNITVNDFNLLKDKIQKSTELMEVFLQENKTIRTEMNRLQTKLDKLTIENIQLRQLLLTPNSMIINNNNNNTNNNNNNQINEQKSTSMLIENNNNDNDLFNLNNSNNSIVQQPLPSSSSLSYYHYNNNNNNYQQQQQINRLRPQSLSTINYNNNNNNNNNDNYKIQRNLSPLNNTNNLLYNNTIDLTNDYRLYQQQQQIESSPLSSLSSHLHQTSPLPNLNQQLSKQQQQTNFNEMKINSSLSKSSASKLPTPTPSTTTTLILPTKDEVIRKIEFITNGIKELLIKAKEEKHNEFHHCSERMCNYVSDMINLFPEFQESSYLVVDNNNFYQLNQALIQLQNNVIYLNELCHSYETFNNNNQHQENFINNNINNNSNNNNRFNNNYNKVIDKAAEIASLVKSIINLYNIQQQQQQQQQTSTTTTTTTLSS